MLCTVLLPINDVNCPAGVASFKYLKVERAAISFNLSSFSDSPSFIAFPRPNPKSLYALLKSLASDDDSPEMYLS